MKILQNNSCWGNPKVALVACLAGLAMLLLPQYGIAQSVTLANGGSTAVLDLGGSDGLNSWTVDTSPINQVDSEWFYYSINGGTAQPLNSLTLQSYSVNQLPSNGGDQVTANYNNSQLSVSITYLLQGSGSGSGGADLSANNVTVTGSGGLTSLNIYEYANFNLLQSSDNSISISEAFGGPPTFPLEGFNGVTQKSGTTALTESITTPFGNFAEAGTAAGVLSDVMSGGNLNDNLSTGPTPGQNVAWAFEWNVTPDTEEDVIQDQTLSISNVPEPSSVALMALGLGAFGLKLVRRRQSK